MTIGVSANIVISSGGFMRKLSRGVLFFPLNRGKSGAARIGGGERSEPIRRMLIMPYDTDSQSRNALASPLGEEGHEVAKGCTRVRMIMILYADVTAEGGIIKLIARKGNPPPFEPACQRQAEPSEPYEPGPRSGPIIPINKESPMTKRNIPVKMNETYTLSIRDLGIHGEGIGSVEDFTVFVPGALPGETVTARIVSAKKSYAQGRLISVDSPSPFRTKPECPAYHACGGCQISHLTYEGQLALKEKRVKDVVSRLGGFSEDLVLPILPADHPWNYRNKMAVPVSQVTGGPVIGYYRQGSHQVVPIDGCLIQEEENNRVLRFAQGFMARHHVQGYNEKSRKGSVRHIMARTGDKGEVMVVIVTATPTLPFAELWVKEMRQLLPEVVSIYHNVQKSPGNVILGQTLHHLWGRKTLTATLAGLSFEVSPFSFFQVHKDQAEKLYAKALEYADLTGSETVIDAYCGTGTISLCLAKKAKKVIGIEIVEAAIEDAGRNADFNHVENVEFHAADAGKLMPKLYKEGLRPDVIVMDPVRAGCSEDVLKAAAAMEPKRIVYVSCNPATFARDAKVLAGLGYTLKKVQPVDMFPQTMHVETVALIEKGK